MTFGEGPGSIFFASLDPSRIIGASMPWYSATDVIVSTMGIEARRNAKLCPRR